LALVFNNGFDHITDGDDADQLPLIEYGQVANAFVGHQGHAFGHGLVQCGALDGRGHDVVQLGGGGAQALEGDFACIVPFGNFGLVPRPVGLQTGWRMMRLFFSEQYLASEHQFDTTRKAGWITESLAHVAIPGVETVEPRPLTEQALAMAHDAEYIAAVRTGQPSGLAQSQGFAWGPGLFPAVCASNGGMAAAALEALRQGVSGSLSSGLHHAKRARGAGYCTFNGLVIAARSALEAGAGLVLILDLDAHCGGGTASLIQGEPAIRQMDISVNAFDRYDSDANSTLVMVDRSAEYLETIDRCLRESILESPGLVLYNAGMDPFEGCDTGGRNGITREVLQQRERMVFKFFRERGIPVAFALAGGYVGPDLSRHDLVDLHRLTIEEAAAAWRVDP